MKHYFLKTCLAMLLFVVGVCSGWAYEWSWTPSNVNDLGTSSATTSQNVTLNGKAWVSNFNQARSSFQTTQKALQIGAQGSVANGTLTTNAFSSYTIKSVTVNCASYNNAHKVSISVGGKVVKAATATSKWTTMGDITTGEIDGTGEIVITVSDGSRAFYLSTITVVYEEDASKTPLATPSNLSSTVRGTKVDLSWDAVSNATGYVVMIDGEQYEAVTNSLTVGPLDENTTYSWKVKALAGVSDTYKNSAESSESEFTTENFIISEGTYDVCPNNKFWNLTTQDGAKSVTANTTFGPVSEYGITFSMNSKTSTNSYMKADHTRVYNGYTLTITAPNGYYLTNIQFTGSTWAAPTSDVGTVNSKTWNGFANEVTFTFSGTSYMSNISVTYANSTTINVSSAGYATYYNEYPYVMPEGLEGKIMEENTKVGGIVANALFQKDEIVPANTALLLKGAARDYTLNFTDADPDEFLVEYNETYNLLRGRLTAGMTEGDGLHYKFTSDEDGLGWYWGAADGAAFNISANKAYLVVPNNLAQSARFISIDDAETSINSINADVKDNSIYDLAGRRINGTTKGMYIINGKKVIF